jgi:cytochrome P450
MKSRMKFQWNVAMSNYTESWRLSRKLLDRGFRQAAIETYRPLLKTKVHALLTQMLAKPDDFEEHFNQCVAFLRRHRSF